MEQPLLHIRLVFFWCGNGYGLQGYTTLGAPNPCPQGGGDDVRWGYYPKCAGTLFPPACGMSAFADFSAHHDWIGMIQNQALNSFRAAFKKYPIQISLATSHNNCLGSVCSANPVPDQDYTVYMVGDYPFPGGGELFSDSASKVYYFALMEGSQEALGQPEFSNGVGWILYSPSSPQNTTAFVNLLKAMGTAMGNSAAHEIGHHLERIDNIKSNNNAGFPYMDCGWGNPGDKNRPVAIHCEGTPDDNFVYSFYNSSGLPQDPTDPSSRGAMSCMECRAERLVSQFKLQFTGDLVMCAGSRIMPTTVAKNNKFPCEVERRWSEMTSRSEEKGQNLVSSLELLFAIYCSFLFAFAAESRPPYAWSAGGRYIYLWHPHAISLTRTDFLLFYAEILLIPALAIFAGLKLISRFFSVRELLRSICGLIGVFGFPIACLYASGRPYFLAVFELAIAVVCFFLWAYRKWPRSVSLNLLLLALHYGFWLSLSAANIGLVARPLVQWGIWDYTLVLLPALGFVNTLLWAYVRRRAVEPPVPGC